MPNHYVHRVGVSTLALMSFAYGGSALAQRVAPTPVQPGSAATSVDEIVVTAEKRPTLLRNVPGGVSVLNAQTLSRARVDNVEDATRLVPGFEFGRSSGEQLAYPTIRGVSPQVFGDPTVSVFQDGFTFANSLKADTEEIFDAERIEVLKGPQATLYGANSLGGAVNIVSNVPSLDTVEGDFRASYGEYDSQLYRGAVSIPIVKDILAVRIGGYYDGRDGYWDNAFNGVEGQDATFQSGARLAVRFRPTDAFESKLIYTYSKTHSDCSDCINPIIGYNPLDPGAVGAGTLDPNHLSETTDTNVPGFYDRSINRVTWENTVRLPGATLTSLTGYGDLDFRSLTDTDRGPGDTIFTDLLVGEQLRVFSEEARAASTGTGPFRWQVGAFYQDSTTDDQLSVGLISPAIQLPISNTGLSFKNFAVFTQDSYRLSNALELQFGLRYDYTTKNQLDNFAGLSATTKSEAWLPKLSLLWHVDSDDTLYATAARGYKTGGTNIVFPGIPPTYAPEYLWNYEAGWKGASPEHHVRYDVAVYYIDWTNQQVQQAVGIFTYLNNAGSTHVYGSEASVHWDPTSHLTFDVGASYNHSRYVNYFDPTALPLYFGFDPNRSGQRTFLSPDFSANLAATYVEPIGGGYDVTFSGNARYTGKESLDTEGVLIGDPYVVANFSISVGDGHKRLTAFVNNAFDERYDTAAFLFAGIQPLTHLGAPRVAGIQFDYHF